MRFFYFLLFIYSFSSLSVLPEKRCGEGEEQCPISTCVFSSVKADAFGLEPEGSAPQRNDSQFFEDSSTWEEEASLSFVSEEVRSSFLIRDAASIETPGQRFSSNLRTAQRSEKILALRPIPFELNGELPLKKAKESATRKKNNPSSRNRADEFVLPEPVLKMAFGKKTPHVRTKRTDGRCLPTSASQMTPIFSPHGQDNMPLGSVANRLTVVSPNQKLVAPLSPTEAKRRQGRRLGRLKRRQHKEIERPTVLAADLSVEAGRILQAEAEALGVLKSEIFKQKEAFIKDSSSSTMCRSEIARTAYEKLILSKDGFGFSRAVLMRDRTLKGDDGRSLKRVVVQNDSLIDIEKVDDLGRTNLERMRQGVAPLGPDNRSINLHHLVQCDHHAILEITYTAHSTAGGTQLHYKRGNPEFGESEVDRQAFAMFRGDYWKRRAEQFKRKLRAAKKVETQIKAEQTAQIGASQLKAFQRNLKKEQKVFRGENGAGFYSARALPFSSLNGVTDLFSITPVNSVLFS